MSRDTRLYLTDMRDACARILNHRGGMDMSRGWGKEKRKSDKERRNTGDEHYVLLRKSSGVIPACFSMARSVPSGMSPG